MVRLRQAQEVRARAWFARCGLGDCGKAFKLRVTYGVYSGGKIIMVALSRRATALHLREVQVVSRGRFSFPLALCAVRLPWKR